MAAVSLLLLFSRLTAASESSSFVRSPIRSRLDDGHVLNMEMLRKTFSSSSPPPQPPPPDENTEAWKRNNNFRRIKLIYCLSVRILERKFPPNKLSTRVAIQNPVWQSAVHRTTKKNGPPSPTNTWPHSDQQEAAKVQWSPPDVSPGKHHVEVIPRKMTDRLLLRPVTATELPFSLPPVYNGNKHVVGCTK